MRQFRMTTRPWLVMVVLLGFGIAGTKVVAQAGVDAQERAIAAIEKIGGEIERDQAWPKAPVVKVYLFFTRVSDAELVHLEGLQYLQVLELSDTRISDAGLVHIKGLTK